MNVWTYKIKSNSGIIITQNSDFAEKKSRLGNIVFCKRESNKYRFKQNQ